MESKDSLYTATNGESLSGLRSRARVPPLTLDPNSKFGSSEEIALVTESVVSSPSASMSPRTPGDTPLTASTDVPPESPAEDEAAGESSPSEPPASRATRSSGAVSGATVASSSSNASNNTKAKAGEPREKRKRSRVTPEQLTHLERFFAADRSPTAARRKEISELLGMQERQTQIWFQNRRAKAKLLDGKKSRHLGNEWSDTPPDTPPQLSAGFEADLHSLIHEDHPVSIIPCTDLSIGSWRRIATGKHDLVAYVCEARRCLTWFIHSAGYGFKMEIPFETITHTEFRNAAPGEGLAYFHLAHPPLFYLEHIASPRAHDGLSPGVGPVIKTWKKCSDWTEGTQASQVFRHDLIGSAVQLAHVLNDLREFRSRASIPLLNPAYATSGLLNTVGTPTSASPTAMQIPQPPLVGLQADVYQHRPSFLGHSRKRSNSGPPAFTRNAVLPSSYPTGDFSPVNTVGEQSVTLPYSAGYISSSFNNRSPAAPVSAFGFSRSRLAPEYLANSIQTTLQQQEQEFGNVPISGVSQQRPFSSGPANTQFFPNERPGNSSPFQLGLPQPPTHLQTTNIITPSPPLISSPYGTDAPLGIGLAGYFGNGQGEQHIQGEMSGSPGGIIGAYGSSPTDILSQQRM